MSKVKASVILATYEWPEALALVLSALLRQSEQNFEILIADDGSGQRTADVVAHYQAHSDILIQRFWQENQGFRKCRILNRAIQKANGKTLIFLDGDCVPHHRFVEQHIALQQRGHYVAGRRVDLSEDFTRSLKPEMIAHGYLESKKALVDLFLDSLKTNGSAPFHRAYMVRTPFLRKVSGLEKVVDLKGCNFSVQKLDMQAIDGFDESYEGYGREDTDVELRLQNLGLSIKSAKNLCLQFHLWHAPRAFTPTNEELLNDVKRTKRIRALRGITKESK